MGNGVVYITNHDRKYSSMKRVCDELKAEGQISAQCRTLFIEDGAGRDASLAAAMQGSNLVIVHLMKNAMNTPLWNHCRDFLCDNKVPFFIDANDGDVQDSRFIDDDKLARFKLYCLYGGPENYKNLWLYAESFNDEHKARSAASRNLTGIRDLCTICQRKLYGKCRRLSENSCKAAAGHYRPPVLQR